MCGFVGLLSRSDQLELDLQAWSCLIQHRGPDQAGHARHRGFAIGTRRLSIQDLSAAGNQPMESERYILAFNGEIYNHLALRAELQSHGVNQFRSHSDTETVLCAVEHWGIEDVLPRLNGMFALALWDKVDGQLTLARDPLGVKPLYYLTTDDAIYFGSELKALQPFAPRRISSDGFALYLYFGFVPAPYALIDGVRKVRAGEAITVNGMRCQSRPLVPRAWTSPEPLPAAPEKRREHVRCAVEAAVRRQLLADVPLGLFLSGGVDSSIIAGVAAAIQPGLASFSLRPDSIAADPGAQRDAELAARYARSLRLEHHELILRPMDLLHEIEVSPLLADEPMAEPYQLAEVLLSRQARAAGVPVVLTGHGGDEVFLGYPTYQAAARGDRYDHLPLLRPALQLLARLPGLDQPMQANLLGTASVWRRSPHERYALVSATHFSLDEAAALSGVPADRLTELVQGVLGTSAAAIQHLPSAGPQSTAELFARLDLLLKVPDHYNLRLDKATMSASIEARVPFQDLELLGTVMQLGREELWRGGLKGLLKQAFADVLPPEVVHRPKQTFQAPVLSWVQDALAPWVGAHLERFTVARGTPLAAWRWPPRSTRDAYRAWSLALVEAWRLAAGLEY